MPPPFGRKPKKTRKQLYLYRHSHLQVLSFSLSALQADDKSRRRWRAAGADVGGWGDVMVVEQLYMAFSCRSLLLKSELMVIF